MWVAERWSEFELIDAGDGEKLERWGHVILRRPDPQAIWPHDNWESDAFPRPQAVYRRSRQGGGHWETRRTHPASWQIRYPGSCGDLTFGIELTGFKHTGLFPEQSVNWDAMCAAIQARRATGRQVRVLNLFAYTGAATVACARAGADETVHLDASRGMNAKARLNLRRSGLENAHVRFLADDARQFVEREIRRDRRYDCILMDPPAYGRGPDGELWRLEDHLYDLAALCARLLSDQPLFFYINTYTTGLAPSVLADILSLVVEGRCGSIQAEEIGLPVTSRHLILPCGATGRWHADV